MQRMEMSQKISYYDLMQEITNQFRKEIQEEIDNEILSKMRLIATKESSRPAKSSLWSWLKSSCSRFINRIN